MGSIYKFYVPDEQKNVICERDETNFIRVNIKNDSHTLVDPTSVSITIRDPCGTDLITAQAMSTSETGVYEYYYDIAADAIFGEYEVEIIATSPSVNINRYRDRYILLPWNAVQEVRRKTGILSKKSVDDKDIALIILEAYEEILEEIYVLHENESFLCNPDDGSWIDGTNKIFQLKNPPVADYNGDGQVTGEGELSCGEDIKLLFKDSHGDCYDGMVKVHNAKCGKVELYKVGGDALDADIQWAKVTYRTEWRTFNEKILRKATVYLAAYECLIRFTSLTGTTQADLNPNVVKFNVRRKSLQAKYKKLRRKIRRPIVGGGMLPGK